MTAEIFIDGVKLENVERIDITIAKPVPPPEPTLAKLFPGTEPNWPVDLTGSDPNTNHLPIGVWHTPCFDIFKDTYIIGVLAFHKCGANIGSEGILAVGFKANNGPVATAYIPTQHPVLGYWGWWCELQAADVDGIIEIRADIVSHRGTSRILQGGFIEETGKNTFLPDNEHSLLLWSNKNGTIHQREVYVSSSNGNDETGNGTPKAPYQTISKAAASLTGVADHATIYLDDGTYKSPRTSLTKNSKGWLTIRPTKENFRGFVKIYGGDGQGSSLLSLIRFQDVFIDRGSEITLPIIRGRSSSLKTHVWFDGCYITGPHALYENASAVITCYNTKSDNYLSFWENFESGPRGWIVYGIEIQHISGDIFTGNRLTRDFDIISHIQKPGQHADLWQGYGGPPNRILCDGVVESTVSQVIFLDDGTAKNTDVAMVNVATKFVGGASASQFGQNMKHVLLWHNEVDQRVLIKDSEDLSLFDGVSINGNVFNKVQFSSRTRQLEQIIKESGAEFQFNNNCMNEYPPALLYRQDHTIHFTKIKRTVRWNRFQNKREELTNCGAS